MCNPLDEVFLRSDKLSQDRDSVLSCFIDIKGISDRRILIEKISW